MKMTILFKIGLVLFVVILIYWVFSYLYIYNTSKEDAIEKRINNYNKTLINSIIGLVASGIFMIAGNKATFGGGPIGRGPHSDITDRFVDRYGPNSGLPSSKKIKTQYVTYRYDSLKAFVDKIGTTLNYHDSTLSLRFYPATYNNAVAGEAGVLMEKHEKAKFQKLVGLRGYTGLTPRGVGEAEFKNRFTTSFKVVYKYKEIPASAYSSATNFDYGSLCPPECDGVIK